MKTIVHVLPYMAGGGTEKHVLTLLREQKNNYNTILFAPGGKILDEFLKLNICYVEFPIIRGNILKKIYIYKKKLSDIQKEYGIDLVHVHAAHEFILFSRKVLPSTPIIFHLSAYQGFFLSRKFNYKLAASIAKNNADLLIAVSEEEKKIIIRNGFPEERVRVVYNGYKDAGDDDELIGEIQRKYRLKGYLIIGNLGRLNRTKRLDILIKAFKIIKNKSNKKIKLLLIGDGPEKKNLQRIVMKNHLNDYVFFPGFVKRGDRVLKIFDVFVLPTTFEGCSNVLIEAMSKKLPIITTNIPSVSWMFENGKEVLLFGKNDIKDLADKLIKLVEDSDYRKMLGENAYHKYKSDFQSSIMARKIDEIYRCLIKG
ncbi:MAG: glycosyltransferase family 4 protein [Candidatus Jordarchaeum sp.]|uniref:glycosyltransferase family 4 protein n=1 Tax=Candidatus Jordarchaeum sp. TaxID=2823881 RepID=UPI00404A5CFE